MAGTGKMTPRASGVAHESGAVDDGAFRESLKASVGGAAVARGTVPAVVTSEKAVSAHVLMSPVAARTQTALVSSAVRPARTPVGETAAPDPGKFAAEGSKTEVPAAKVGSEDLATAVASQAGVAAGRDTLAAQGAKPVAGGEEVRPAAGAKTLKGDAVTVGKKAPAKSGDDAVPAAAAPAEPASAVPVMGSVPVVAAQAIAMAASPVGADASELQVQTPGAAVTGSGTARVGGATSPVKGSGREAKKVDAGVAMAKAEPSTAAAAASHVGGSGAGVLAGKDGTAGIVTQAGVGTAVAGTVASHVGITGLAGAKVAASVATVSAPAGQGATAGPEVKTLAATPNLLEVGIDGGTHGWLRVRAELGQTGEVTASMVAGSAGQADTLRRELPAMSTYLAGESVGVSSLVVNAAGAAAGAQDAAMSLGADAQGGGENARAQGGADGAQSGRSDGRAGRSEDGVAGLGFGGAELPAAVYANGSGSWLSVRV